jgi:hypothetical protein
MNLAQIVVVLVVVGALLWAVGKFMPDGTSRQLAFFVILGVTVIYLFQALGGCRVLQSISIGR